MIFIYLAAVKLAPMLEEWQHIYQAGESRRIKA